MGTSYNTNIVTDGLTDCWDAGNRKSWDGHDPVTADPFYDLAGDFPAYMINVGGGPDNLSFDPAHMGSITFDGTDDRIQVGSTGAGAGSIVVGWTEISVCVWAWVESNNECAKLVSTKHANSLDMGVCVQDDHSATDTNWFFCYINGDYLPTPTGSIIPHVGKWTHYVVTRNSGYTTRLYLDGELKAETTLGGAIGAADYNMCFGNREDGARPLEGKMASVYLYNRALSAAEVKQNYEATKTRFAPRITTDGLFASWDAGDPASYNGGQTWTDTANGFVGPFYNGAGEAISFDPANGGSLVFDGTDDRIGPIMLPGDYSGTARSIILWVSPDTHEQEMIAFNSADDKFKATVGQSASYGTYIFRADVGGNSPQVGSFADSLITVEDWACIGMTINASDEIVSMYLNGVSKTGGAQGWNFQADTYIGRSSTGAPWNGKIATVRLYTKTLSAGEVLDNYQKTKARFGH